MLTYLLAVGLLLNLQTTVSGFRYNHFSGGSMSYVVEENAVTGKQEAHIDLITGWVLGKGPCGPTCSKHDVGKDTVSQRAAVESTKHDEYYFGNWSTETGPPLNVVPGDINDEVRRNMKGTIIAISEIGKWEQEHMTTVVVLNAIDDEEDVVFEGYSWRDLPLQRSTGLKKGLWHFQSQIDIRKRSDTGKPNASPKALIKPFYRVRLNSITQITIPAIDSEDDIVKCTQAYHVEGGILSTYKLPGLDVNENCTLTINTSSSLGYTDDLWGGIAITVRDYNREDIEFDGKKVLANRYAIGGSTVQFLIQVLENIYEPEFVSPTHPSNHGFYLYAGSTWNVKLYAKSSENTSIAEFLVLGRQNEKFNISDMQDDPNGRDRVKSVTVSWNPENNDKGRHIICVRAIDSTGVDTKVDRCFLIEVKDTIFHATNTSLVKPYFVDLPSYNETLECSIDATCVFPIYVHSTEKIVDIKVEVVFDVTKPGGITQTTHNGELLYKMDLALMHNEDGLQELCLTATGENGTSSDRVCIRSEIIPTDPCISSPCLNSAKCSRTVNDTADYECKCFDAVKFEGKNCDLKEFHDCDPSPCGPGRCAQRHTGGFICVCRHTGFTGTTCSINEDDCTPTTCNGHGICKDGIQNATCSCYERYNETDCSYNRCPTEPADQLTCSASLPGCYPDPCNNGTCLAGGNCVCPLAYSSDPKCITETGDVGQIYTKVTFVPPTLVDKSDIVCYTGSNCSIPVYLASPNSPSPNIRVETSEDMRQNVHVQQPSVWSGLYGIQNMYRSAVAVLSNKEDHTYICLIASDNISDERRCFSLSFKPDPSLNRKSIEYKQKNIMSSSVCTEAVSDETGGRVRCGLCTHGTRPNLKAIKFLDPTPKGDTRFVCYNGTQYHLLLYTTISSAGTCDSIIPSETDVVVFDPSITDGGDCQTEVTYTFGSLGTRRICFQSSSNTSQSQLRCFDFYVQDSDPCTNSPCQNNAKCFHDVSGSTAGVYCECLPNYSGKNCDTGPCLQSDNICTNGYCYVEDRNITCMCPIGFKGDTCAQSLPDGIPDPYNDGARFTDIAIPQTVTCVRNRPCSFPLVSSGRFNNNDRPNVVPGYVHPTINILDLYTDTIKDGSFISGVVISGKQTGINDMCLQILNAIGMNKDEICIKVNVTEERSSTWAEKDKPHFVNPSLPPNTEVTCFGSGPCHIVLFATPGEKAQSGECVELHVASDTHLLSHISSPCENCSAVQDSNNCTFDLVMFPETKTSVCLTAFTSITQSSGEKRCFTVDVQQAPSPSGCQLLHCLNGGFCDGHEEPAICHCPLPYSGNDCSIDTSVTTSSSPNTFSGLVGMPQIVKCYPNSPCVVSFTASGPSPTVHMGYVSPGLYSTSPNVTVDVSTNLQTGTVAVTPLDAGKHMYCMQMISVSTVVDELCITAIVEGVPDQTADKTRPYFVQPTLPTDTFVLCEAGKACHLELHFTPGSLFNSSELCPFINDVSSNTGHKLHIFPSSKTPQDCRSDISFIPPASSEGNDELLCFEVTLPAKRGERRCFNIHIVADIPSEISRPCLSKTCENEAICIAEFPSDDTQPALANCICTTGYSGDECNTLDSAKEDLPGVSGINATTSPNITSVHTPHFDGNAGLPDTLVCEMNKPCLVYIPYTGEQNYLPQPGHIDMGLNVTGTSVLSIDDHHHVQVLQVVGSQTGNKTICVQTTVEGVKRGENIDEICTAVEILPPGSLNTVSSQELSIVPDNATLTCKENQTCHLTFVSSISGECPKLRECGSGIPGVHIYSSVTTSGVCVTDLAIRTKALETTQDLCVTPVSPTNEERHIKMRTAKITDYGPCQKLHCKNGGFCDIDNGMAVCLCVNHFTGTECEIAPCTNSLPVVPHATHTNNTVFSDGFRVNYTCMDGYELFSSDDNGYICVSGNNSWFGEDPQCIALACTGPLPTVTNATPANITVFPDGLRVNYTCLDGYELIDSDLNAYTCVSANNSWIGEHPQCIPKVCTSPLPTVTNATHTHLTVFPDGMRVNYTCLDGYEFAESHANGYTCVYRNNSWVGKNPQCIFKVCTSPLPTVTNATHTHLTVFPDGMRVNYTCLNGYEFAESHANGYTCVHRNNSWVGEKPQCILKVCTSPLPVIANATHPTIAVFPDGVRVNYTCDNGYMFIRPESNGYTCYSGNNSWIGEEPRCIPKVCTSSLPTVTNANHSNLTAFPDGIRVNYTCVDGYEFVDSNVNGYTCVYSNNSWIGEKPECIPKVCTSPLPTVTNATHTHLTVFPDGMRVNYTCLNGYEFAESHANGYTCVYRNNSWVGEKPQCILKVCTSPLPVIANATYPTIAVFPDGVRVNYTCDNGYMFIRTESNGYTCYSGNNSWIGEEPRCIPKDCTRPLPAVLHATHPNITVLPNSLRVNYTCSGGYEFKSPDSNAFTCVSEHNSWVGEQPQCVPKSCKNPLPAVEHATRTHANSTVFTEGTRVTYTCSNGYELEIPGSNGYTCLADTNTWIGEQPQCIAKENCFNSSDCIHGTCNQTDQTCICDPGYNNTNCDTIVAGMCDWKEASTARQAIKQGKTSCYCMVQTPGDTAPRKLQIIKRRPVMTMEQILTAAGMGAGGMAGGMGVALVIYIVVSKVKGPGKRPLPTPSPRSKRVSPIKH